MEVRLSLHTFWHLPYCPMPFGAHKAENEHLLSAYDKGISSTTAELLADIRKAAGVWQL